MSSLSDGHGFAGILGAFEGHPSLRNDTAKPNDVVIGGSGDSESGLLSPVTASPSSSEKKSPTEAEQWSRSQSGVTTFEDLVEAIAKARSAETSPSKQVCMLSG